jgi:hypothetical protein
VHGETLPLPERCDGVLLSVEAMIAIAKDEGRTIGAGETACGGTNERHDLFEILSEGEALDDFDQLLDRRMLWGGGTNLWTCFQKSACLGRRGSRPGGGLNSFGEI